MAKELSNEKPFYLRLRLQSRRACDEVQRLTYRGGEGGEAGLCGAGAANDKGLNLIGNYI